MCSGSKKREEKRRREKAEEEYRKAQAEADKRAKEQQEKLDRLAASREAAAAAQQERLFGLQRQQEDMLKKQEQRKTSLQAQNAARQKAVQEETALRQRQIAEGKAQQQQQIQMQSQKTIADANFRADVLRQKAQELNATAQETARQSAIDVKNTNISNSAISSSLRILSKGGNDPGPTAQQSKKTTRAGRAKTTNTGLKLGSQANTSGSNISI